MEIRQELLEILRENGKARSEDIALMLGIGADEVKAMREELEREGMILGYNAVINWNKLDDVQAVIEVKVKPQRERGFDSVAQRIMAFEEVSTVYLMSGSYDLLVVLDGKDMREVALFVAEKLSTIDGVLSTATSFVLRKYKENGQSFRVNGEGDSDRMAVS